ncbi:MAG: type I DNA topoisomerase [Candidatus Hydrogenedentes bacterium]|nr:type I DNA topoisomerase [Candidatus Hydrogenedentota bacterium]
MPKYLVVVESPAKAKTINKFLGGKYLVKASYGHVRDLPKRDLGVDVEHNFEPKYVRLRESAKAIKDLKAAAEKCDHVLLATDPDREGEAIGWHVAELLKAAKKPMDRIVFNEITKRRIREAVENPRPIDEDLVNAYQARRVLDRLVGYKISPMLQWSVRKGLSAGRVQSVAVRMVCEREAEIRAFEPEEYWTLDALLQTERNEALTARLSKIRGETAKLGNQEAVQAVLRGVEGETFRVNAVERKEVRRHPYPPFITSSMQQEASRKLRFSPRKTDRIAQQLYDGIELGPEGAVGLITYMRTDSTRLASEAIEDVRGFIGAQFAPEMLPEKPNFYKSKKGAQDAHEAIRPTLTSRTPEAMAAFLNEDQLKLYTLIWKRFVACQMASAVLDQTAVDIAAGECMFRATGSIVKFRGFTALYEETQEDKGEGENGGKELPDVKEGEGLSLEGLKPEQHFTKPPPRYSEASLIRALEENGIGRPSTYAPTINVVLDRGYVVREKGRLMPTELGEEVNGLLVKNFPDILDIAFTARLEDDLDHVEEGRREWHELLREFYVDFEKDLDEAQRRMVAEAVGEDARCPECGSETTLQQGWYGPFLRCVRYPECSGKISLRKKAQAEPTDEICEECGSPMVIRMGRFGRFLACSNYPKCKNTHNIDEQGNKIERPPREKPVKTDQKCPDCGGFLLIRKNRRGEPFYGCENYPKCRFTKPMELNLKCPRPGCGGELVSKRAKGRRFVGCDKYPECDFAVFGQVDKDTPCPKCGNGWTILFKPRGKPRVRQCPVPSCDYEEEAPE